MELNQIISLPRHRERQRRNHLCDQVTPPGSAAWTSGHVAIDNLPAEMVPQSRKSCWFPGIFQTSGMRRLPGGLYLCPAHNTNASGWPHARVAKKMVRKLLAPFWFGRTVLRATVGQLKDSPLLVHYADTIFAIFHGITLVSTWIFIRDANVHVHANVWSIPRHIHPNLRPQAI